jgi:hypothetical protein
MINTRFFIRAILTAQVALPYKRRPSPALLAAIYRRKHIQLPFIGFATTGGIMTNNRNNWVENMFTTGRTTYSCDDEAGSVVIVGSVLQSCLALNRNIVKKLK